MGHVAIVGDDEGSQKWVAIVERVFAGQQTVRSCRAPTTIPGTPRAKARKARILLAGDL
jgi:hypothetical protein